ncbi:MAG TPA: acetyl-coenzyme A synthetase N-terminal domain-containing protein, partial [Vicinamibacterales bacterium]|nr:acetyl-coenzyme A synthetase N-terminal domain-containing protein [Vicinamibacterales bacterium]
MTAPHPGPLPASGEREKYAQDYRQSLQAPEQFWADRAKALHWDKPWTRILSADGRRWFEGGELNTCHNALDRHVDSGRADQVALIYDSPVTNTVRKYTYRELR